jgi:hypothetical protein
MITQLPQEQTIGSQLGAALQQGLQTGFNSAFQQSLLQKQQQKQQQMQHQEQQREVSALQQALSQAGQDPQSQLQALLLAPVSNETKKIFGQHLAESHQQNAKRQQQLETDKESYNTIERNFGKKAADLWKAAPTGGKTDILKNIFEANKRGLDLDNYLSSRSNLELTGDQERKPRAIDFDKGKTPAERSRAQDARYKTNLPLYEESEKNRQALDSEGDLLEILDELSPKISLSERLNINPFTGDLLVPALSSPEAQRFVKTVNEFTRNAKDTYGSRVTNFDLTQFLKRLPTLANSEEGRREIIEQMKIINEVNKTHNAALHNIVEGYGGIRNIDWDRAQSFADRDSKPKIQELKKRFKNISSSLDDRYQSAIDEKKKIVPKGQVAVEKADGSMGYIPRDNLQKFLEVEGNRAL